MLQYYWKFQWVCGFAFQEILRLFNQFETTLSLHRVPRNKNLHDPKADLFQARVAK